MRIAIIGWGSLIWSPRDLAIETKWRAGPRLPVEFARTAKNGRVTLALAGTVHSSAWWALSTHRTFEAASENLRQREGSAARDIHFTSDGQLHTASAEAISEQSLDAASMVHRWLRDTPDVEGAVWTGLPRNRFDPVDDLSAQVITYLQSLRGETLDIARAYIENAPATVETPVRSSVQDQLGWMPATLNPDFFA